MIAATGSTNPIGVISKRESALKTPQDLVGKKIGMPPGTEQEQIWPAFLKKTNVDASKVSLISITDALPAALQRGQIDGYVSYATDLPGLEKSMIKGLIPIFGRTFPLETIEPHLLKQ